MPDLSQILGHLKLFEHNSMRNWIRLVQIWSNLTRLVQTCPKWKKLVQHGSNLFELDQTCPNWTKLVQFGSKVSKLDQTCSNWINCVQIGVDLSKLLSLQEISVTWQYYLLWIGPTRNTHVIENFTQKENYESFLKTLLQNIYLVDKITSTTR